MSMDEEKLKEKRTAKFIAKMKAELPWGGLWANKPDPVADKLRKTSEEATRVGIDTKTLIQKNLDREIYRLYLLKTPVCPFWVTCILLVGGLYIIHHSTFPFHLGIISFVVNMARFTVISNSLRNYQLLEHQRELLLKRKFDVDG